MTARLATLALATILLAAAVAQAKPPATEQTAMRLHEQAKEAYADGRIRAAIELWRGAAQLHEHWKYAYNLCNCLYEDRQFLEARAACDEARTLGMPAQYTGHIVELEAKIDGALLDDHARIELSVEPGDAVVLRDGEPWAAPRLAWTRATGSRIIVRAPGFVTVDVAWEHPAGKRYSKRIALVARAAKPPEVVAPAPVAPVSKPEPAIVVTTPPEEPSRALAIGGWTGVGLGIGALAGGAVLFALAEGRTADLNALSTNVAALVAYDDYPSYEAYARGEEEAIGDRRDQGWALAGTGAALAVVGAVLLALDASSDPAQTPTAFSPVALPGGGGLQATVRF